MAEVYRQHGRLFQPASFKDGRLDNWVEQGVFLMNKLLTGSPPRIKGHKGKGWEIITKTTMEILGDPKRKPTVFLLWGKELQEYRDVIDTDVHLIIDNVYPGAQIYNHHSKKFSEGNNCFLEANKFLRERGRGEINWIASSPDQF